jgi:hypothetical protein
MAGLTPPEPEVESSPVSAKGSNFCRFWIAELATQSPVSGYSSKARERKKEYSSWYHVFHLVIADTISEGVWESRGDVHIQLRRVSLFFWVIWMREIRFTGCARWRDGRWMERVLRWDGWKRCWRPWCWLHQSAFVCGCGGTVGRWRYHAWIIGHHPPIRFYLWPDLVAST